MCAIDKSSAMGRQGDICLDKLPRIRYVFCIKCVVNAPYVGWNGEGACDGLFYEARLHDYGGGWTAFDFELKFFRKFIE